MTLAAVRSRRPQSAILEDITVAASRMLRLRFLAAARADAAGEDSEALWAAYARDTERLFLIVALLGASSVPARLGRPLPPRRRPVLARFAAVDIKGFEPIALPAAEAAFRKFLPDIEELLVGLRPAADAASSRVVAHSRARVASALEKVAETAFRPAPEVVPGAAPAVATTLREIAEKIAKELNAPAAEVRTIVRTTTQAAYNEGARVQYDSRRDIFPLRRLSEIRDLRTRGNPRGLDPEPHRHWQMDGFVAYSDDPIWETVTPPNGWNCRGSINGVTASEARRNGWISEDGTITPEQRALVARTFAKQRAIVERGEYPDPGFVGSLAS
jgi:hypothetical protein